MPYRLRSMSYPFFTNAQHLYISLFNKGAYSPSIAAMAALMMLVLKAPQRPRLEVTTTTMAWFTSRATPKEEVASPFQVRSKIFFQHLVQSVGIRAHFGNGLLRFTQLGSRNHLHRFGICWVEFTDLIRSLTSFNLPLM